MGDDHFDRRILMTGAANCWVSAKALSQSGKIGELVSFFFSASARSVTGAHCFFLTAGLRRARDMRRRRNNCTAIGFIL